MLGLCNIKLNCVIQLLQNSGFVQVLEILKTTELHLGVFNVWKVLDVQAAQFCLI